MYVKRLNIENFRSIENVSGSLELGKLNILIGANNAGKSSILKALSLIQGNSTNHLDIRTAAQFARIQIYLNDIPRHHPILQNRDYYDGVIAITLHKNGSRDFILDFGGGGLSGNAFPPIEPHHFIIPFLSKRKTAQFNQDVREQHAKAISDDLQYLSAKLSRISTPGYPSHEIYKRTCIEVLGFLVSAIPSDSGLRPGIYLDDGSTLPIEQMGEGVPHIVAFLISLADSKGKLFLIEELENDLHPKALKAILDLIIESSKNNQFVISTHSNIVVRHLASVTGSKLYNIKTVPGLLPTKAEVKLVPSTVEARVEVLRELGYSFADFELWDGWLILEEASAERVIRDYLIPWFVPELTRIRTLSTGGADAVEPTFNDFNRLVRFTHLEEAYRNKGWVRVDGDSKGVDIIVRLKNSYSTWEPNRFATYKESQFEKYYPHVFAEEVRSALGQEGQKRREAKKLLLEKVRAWLDEDRARAEDALKESADEIIKDLQVIAKQLKGA
jgi:energy-coupling factor transporter ATP-binding protein EcfA2